MIVCGAAIGIAKWRTDCDEQPELSKIPDVIRIEYRKESAILDKYDAKIAEIDRCLHSESDKAVKSTPKAKRKKLVLERNGLVDRIYKRMAGLSGQESRHAPRRLE